MSGINGTNKKQKQYAESAQANFAVPASGNPSPFSEDGMGTADPAYLFKKYPDFAAVAGNANATITNNATSKSNGFLYQMYLFVDHVDTAWTLSGETAQGQLGRVFYPRNMTQGDFTVTGTVANQYEYDRIVHFVEHHHFSQMKPQGARALSLDGDNYPSVDFMLYRPGISTNAPGTFDAFDPLYYNVVITNMAAGHERFLNFPTYTLTCKVIYDHLEKPYHLQFGLANTVTAQDVFGNSIANPTPATAGSVTANPSLDSQTNLGGAPQAVTGED